MLNRSFSLSLLLSLCTFTFASEEDPASVWAKVVASGEATDFTVTDDVTIQCVIFYAENTAMQQPPRCAYWQGGEFVAELVMPFSHDVKHAEKSGEQVVIYASSDKCSYGVAFDFSQFEAGAIEPGVPVKSASVEELNCWR